MLTEPDRPYESTEELKTGRMLDQYGIPFFYKQATIIYHEGRNEIWKPSFTVYTCGGLVIDAGNPKTDIGPEESPNGGIINMGAYGGTAEASMSP
jgi:hypothetical protein